MVSWAATAQEVQVKGEVLVAPDATGACGGWGVNTVGAWELGWTAEDMVDVGLVVATLGGVVAQRAVAQMAEGVAGLRGAKVGEA